MRPEVQTFVAVGTLPDWDAEEKEIYRRVKQLEAITAPVTRNEAQALAACFGPDDCYGVAWSLLHLIEAQVQCQRAHHPDPMPMAGTTRSGTAGETRGSPMRT
ncbi:hypothetical protein [Streptomyces sp. NPDC059215]|uniref:hypothetical protein n=1 Tax=Streptomyces sp. NPDC059215 TaxID=3346772 RepID=UPI00369B1ABE